VSVVINVPMEELVERLGADVQAHVRQVEKARHAAALHLKAYLVELTDEMGITDMGIYKNSFVVEGGSVTNEAPHAGIVELGARPHKTSQEGREAIRAWCVRKLGLSEEEAESASWAIVQKHAEVGQEGRYVMKSALPKALEFFHAELSRVLGPPGEGHE
jgi:hypothetical protein